jgi:hypothetical protein
MPASTDFDFNSFRKNYRGNTDSLMRKQLVACGAEWPDNLPWLQVDFPVSIPDRPILVHRCQRKSIYNKFFPWKRLVSDYRDRMVFVGLPDEHSELVSECGYIPMIKTANFLELARLISGCRVFVGSQSSPLAVAIGLGANIIQEVMDIDQACYFERDNIIYPKNDEFNIPKEWLL